MGFSVDRANIELRTIGGVPWQPWRNPYWRFNIGGPVHPAREVQGYDTVLGLAAVYSAVRYIADAIASLPITVYRDLGGGRAERLPGSALFGNIVRGGGPSLYGTTYEWVFTMYTSALLWGNSWGIVTGRSGVIGPDGLGLPSGVEWLPPDRVSVQDDEMQPENPLRAQVYYMGQLMDRRELVHMRAFTVPGRLEGISPLRAHAMLWQQGLDALRYSADWFQNGGFPPGTFQNTAEEVDDTQAKEIRRRLTDTLRLRQPLVYGRDWEYKPIVVPPNEAAFIQAMQLNATQVAAIYGITPTKIGGTRGDSMNYTSEVQNTLRDLNDTLRPWITRGEHLMSSLLPATQYVKFDTRAMLRTDPKTKAEIEQIERVIGKRTANELRHDDDLADIPGGDDALPLGVLERMMATTRLVPKVYLPQVMFEQDHIMSLLESLQAQGLISPETPGVAPAGSMTPAIYAGRQIVQGRANPLFGDALTVAKEADKGEAKSLLQRHLQAGNLTHDEMIKRLARVHEAQTHGDLASLFHDLPHLPAVEEPDLTGGERKLPSRVFGPPEIRAANEDRARAIDLLSSHAAAGRLTGEELQERVAGVAKARTFGDLEKLFSDLPATAPPPPEEPPGPPKLKSGAIALVELRARAGNPSLNGHNT